MVMPIYPQNTLSLIYNKRAQNEGAYYGSICYHGGHGRFWRERGWDYHKVPNACQMLGSVKNWMDKVNLYLINTHITAKKFKRASGWHARRIKKKAVEDTK